MPAPIPDLSRNQQCHHYQAPSGQRCGSPAIKGEYYCYHHHIAHVTRNSRRVLIDPEITRMQIPPILDRASIFVALAAVVQRLAENTIDTRRAGQMIYALQVALQALQSAPATLPQTSPATETSSTAISALQPATDSQPATPLTHVAIRRQSLLHFLRSRHCANCNAELFPASELTEPPNLGAPPEVIEESRPALPAPQPATENLQPATVLSTVQSVASDSGPGPSNLVPGTLNLAGGPLPLSSVFVDNGKGCAWPDRTSFRNTIQDCQKGRTSPVSRRAKWEGLQ